jgi:Fe-S-cluster containining protein
MELGEATALADKLATRAIFKLHSLPLYEHGKRARLWWKGQGGSLSARKALEETRQHLAHFSVRDDVDKARGISLHLTISALTMDREKGRCPALAENRCSIYQSRPLTCRTVPLHYSRPLSTLPAYLDHFVSRPDYLCSTSAEAAVVLQGDMVDDPSLLQARQDAIAMAEGDRNWKNEIVALMSDPDQARAVGLPSYETVLRNSDAGGASLVSMIAPWRVAKRVGILTPGQFDDVCLSQSRLLRTEIARCLDPGLLSSFQDMLAEYDVEAANSRKSLFSYISGFRADDPRGPRAGHRDIHPLLLNNKSIVDKA